MRSWLRFLSRRNREQELDNEINAHLAIEIRNRIERGESEEDARIAALRDFGNVSLVKEITREFWGRTAFERFIQDIRYTARIMRRSPGVTIVAVLSLALAIGANSAIFSVVDAVLLKTLPVRNPDELVELLTKRGEGEPFNFFSYQALNFLTANTKTLQAMIGSARSRFSTLDETGQRERVDGQYVTGNYFTALGVSPLLGRAITPEDDRFASPNAVAVIGEGLWRSRFGADPGVVGRSLSLENVSFTVIGVVGKDFYGTQVGSKPDVWIPLSMEPQLRRPSMTASSGPKWIQLMGRLRPEVSFDDARSELEVLFRRAVVEVEFALQKDGPAKQAALKWTAIVEPAGTGLSDLRHQFSRPLQVLMLIVSFVLLIACGNIANLLLARAAARDKEMAIRTSIGAGRLRLIRQVLTESLILALLGGGLGLLTASWGSRQLVNLLASGRTPVSLDVRLDPRVIGFTLFVSVLTAIVFGLAPAMRVSRANPATLMKGSNAIGHTRKWASHGLVAGQIALLIALIFGAGLFLQSLRNLHSIPLGFQPQNLLVLQADPAHSGYSPDQLRNIYTDLIETFESLPGVQSASLSWVTPITGGGSNGSVFLDQGESERRRVRSSVFFNWVAPKYFSTIGTPLIAGRDFNFDDSRVEGEVAIVNQAFAERHLGGNAVGKRIFINDGNSPIEIIGVVGNAKYLEIRETIPDTVYLNVFRDGVRGSQFVVRTSTNAAGISNALRREIQQRAGGIAVLNLKTLTAQVDASIVRERLLALLAAFFGGLALLLAALGLYGVIAYRTARRTKEFGIRTALGALPSEIIGMVLRETLVVVLVGVGAGIPLAIALMRFVAGLLYDVTPLDPIVIASSVLTLAAVTLVAGFMPARRASRIDCVAAIREE